MIEIIAAFLAGAGLASIIWGIRYFRMFRGFQHLWENERAGNYNLTKKLTAYEKDRQDLGGKDDRRKRKK